MYFYANRIFFKHCAGHFRVDEAETFVILS